MERKNVYVSKTKHGEGLFAKRTIYQRSVVAYYSGLIFSPKDSQELVRNMTLEQAMDWNSCLMPMQGNGKKYEMNIPKSQWPLEKYRATLGHKANRR